MKDAVANAPAAHNIPVVQIESKTAQINDVVEYDLSERLKETFGVVASGIDIGAIEIDKSSEGYRQLMSVTKDLAGATAKAEAQAKIKDISNKQRIEAENYEETLRIQREEGQYAQRMHTRTENFGAYQVEKQAEVGVAGAPVSYTHLDLSASRCRPDLKEWYQSWESSFEQFRLINKSIIKEALQKGKCSARKHDFYKESFIFKSRCRISLRRTVLPAVKQGNRRAKSAAARAES